MTQNEEDQALKDNLQNWVEATKSVDIQTKEDAVYKIFHEVISATSSMTSIPKPMKFLVLHYQTMVDAYTNTPAGKTKVGFIDSRCSSQICWLCCQALWLTRMSSKPTST